MNILSDFKKNKYGYLYLFLIAFLLLKMIRGMSGEVSSGGGVWNVIQLLFIFFGFVFFCSKYSNNNTAVNLLIIYSFWVMVVSLLHMGTHPIISLSSIFYYLATLCAPSVLLIFYCVAQKNDIQDFSLWIKMAFYLLIALYYFSMTAYRVVDADEEYIAFANIYFPITLLPLILFLTKPSRSFIPFFFILIGIVVSGKRGGLVIVALMAFAYYFFGKKRNVGNSIILLILFSIILYVSLMLIDYFDAAYGMHTIDRMMNSVNDGGSGRIGRWGIINIALGSSSFMELLFGHGFNAIYALVGGRAHNDFLEIFYNFGFVAFFIYTLFYICLISINIKQYKKRYPRAKYLTCSIIVSLVLALVSFFVVDPTFVLSSMFTTGLFLGDWSKYLKCINNN